MPSTNPEGSLSKTRITCPNCRASYAVPSEFIPYAGCEVECTNCNQSWYFRSTAGHRLTPSDMGPPDRSDLVEEASTEHFSYEECQSKEPQKIRPRDLLTIAEIRMIVEGQDDAIRHFANSSRMYATDPKGDTALHLAARTANLALCNLLVNSGADPAALNFERQTPADVAFSEGHQLVAQLLSSNVESSFDSQEFDTLHKIDSVKSAEYEDRTISSDHAAPADRSNMGKATQDLHAEDAKTTWTEDRVERLTRLWAKGWSAGQIARELGATSRNAVLGKAHRLGLLGNQGVRTSGPEGKAFLATPEITRSGLTVKTPPIDNETIAEPISQKTHGQFSKALREWHAGSYWTDDRNALLKRLWSEQKGAAEIARELGRVVTPGAVLHQIHRLGIHDIRRRDVSSAEETNEESSFRNAMSANDLSGTAKPEISFGSDTPNDLDDLLSFEAEKEPEDFFGQTVSSSASGTFVAQVGQLSVGIDEHEGDWELDLTPAKIGGDGIGDLAQNALISGSEHDFLKVGKRGRHSLKRAVVQAGTRLSIDPEICMTWVKDVLAKGWFGFDDIEALISVCDGNGDPAELHTNLKRDLEAAGLDFFEHGLPDEIAFWDVRSDVSSDELAEAVEAALNRATPLPGTRRFVMDKSDELQLLEPMMRAKQELQLGILACEPAVETILDIFESILDGCRDPGTVSLRSIMPTRPGHTETENVIAAAEKLRLWQANGRAMHGRRRREALAALETLDLSLAYQRELLCSLREAITEDGQTGSLEAKITAFELATEQLVQHHLPYVRRFSARHVEDGEDPEDVFQVAYMGLQRSMRRFDPERGIRFVIYASFWMRQYLKRWRADEGALIRVPVHRFENIAKLDRALEARDLRFDAVVADKDLAVDLELTAGEVQMLRKIPRDARYPESLDEWDDILPEPEDESVLEQAETKSVVLEALGELNERQADVIRKRFGIGRDSEMTLEEIGQQYGLTRERIRQIEAKGLKILSHPGRLRRLQELLGK